MSVDSWGGPSSAGEASVGGGSSGVVVGSWASGSSAPVSEGGLSVAAVFVAGILAGASAGGCSDAVGSAVEGSVQGVSGLGALSSELGSGVLALDAALSFDFLDFSAFFLLEAPLGGVASLASLAAFDFFDLLDLVFSTGATSSVVASAGSSDFFSSGGGSEDCASPGTLVVAISVSSAAGAGASDCSGRFSRAASSMSELSGYALLVTSLPSISDKVVLSYRCIA